MNKVARCSGIVEVDYRRLAWQLSKSASFQSIGVSRPAVAEFWRGRYLLMGSRRMTG
ncbi:hypothetical protein WN943_020096 [Citrus x changshan-huyou]